MICQILGNCAANCERCGEQFIGTHVVDETRFFCSKHCPVHAAPEPKDWQGVPKDLKQEQGSLF